jgi:hypothetical protein
VAQVKTTPVEAAAVAQAAQALLASSSSLLTCDLTTPK